MFLNCVIVRNSIRPLIIGMDVLIEWQANLYFALNKFSFQEQNKIESIDYKTNHFTRVVPSNDSVVLTPAINLKSNGLFVCNLELNFKEIQNEKRSTGFERRGTK